jgi:hypothetical protein
LTFLNPTLAFAGLAAISIPITIHFLMRRRRKPVMWGAMRFLLEAYRRQRQRLRLEQLLLLAARCAVVALIALALGRPLLGAAGLAGRGATTVYLLVDNSLASSAEDGSAGARAALERSRELGVQVLAGLDATLGDRAGLIALGGPADAMVMPASSDLGSVKALVEGLRPTDSAADLGGASRLLAEELGRQEPGGRTVVAVLSDFLAGSGGPETSLSALALGGQGGVQVLASGPVETGPTNIAITGVQPVRAVMLTGEGSETPNQVRVFLSRSGPGVGEAAVTTVRVRIAHEGEAPSAIAAPAEQVVRWAPGQATATAAVAAGAPGSAGQGVLIAEIDRDAVAGDNAWRRPVQVRDSLRIGLIAPRVGAGREGIDPSSSADWLRLALAPTSLDRALWQGRSGEMEVVGIEPGGVDASRLAGLDVAVVASPEMLSADSWRRLRLLADGGGVVVVVPPAGPGVQMWTDEMVRAMGLDWTIGREPVAMGAPDRPGQGVGLSAARDPRGDLLELIASELSELVKPVHVWRALPVSARGDSAERVLSLADGSPWVIASPPGASEAAAGAAPAGSGRGLVIFFASSLAVEWTDLAGKPLLVPLVQELVRQGVGRARSAWTEVAGVRIGAPARAVELRPDPMGDFGPRPPAEGAIASIAVDDAGFAASPIRHAGILRAVDERGVTRGLVAVNADPRGSATDAQSRETIGAWLGTLGGAVRWIEEEGQGDGGAGAALASRESDHQSSLSLLIAALCIGMAEVLMARWFSHATVAPGGPGAQGVPA